MEKGWLGIGREKRISCPCRTQRTSTIHRGEREKSLGREREPEDGPERQGGLGLGGEGRQGRDKRGGIKRKEQGGRKRRASPLSRKAGKHTGRGGRGEFNPMRGERTEKKKVRGKKFRIYRRRVIS